MSIVLPQLMLASVLADWLVIRPQSPSRSPARLNSHKFTRDVPSSEVVSRSHRFKFTRHIRLPPDSKTIESPDCDVCSRITRTKKIFSKTHHFQKRHGPADDYRHLHQQQRLALDYLAACSNSPLEHDQSWNRGRSKLEPCPPPGTHQLRGQDSTPVFSCDAARAARSRAPLDSCFHRITIARRRRWKAISIGRQ